jgi:hypothetical protein
MNNFATSPFRYFATSLLRYFATSLLRYLTKCLGSEKPIAYLSLELE